MLKICQIKRFLLKTTPYFVSFGVGVFFFVFSNKFNENFENLFLSLSASFISIPLIYLFYKLTKNISQRKLNKEIFDYSKMKIDKEILSITEVLFKIMYPYDKQRFNLDAIDKFLSFNLDDLKENFRNNKYLGFQIFKRLDFTQNRFQEILENPFLLDRLADQQIQSIILIIKKLRRIESLRDKNIHKKNNKKESDSYKIVSGKEINPDNTKYPNRLLLLKHIENDKHFVQDFGDFKEGNKSKLLNYFTVKESYVEVYAEKVFDVVSEINKWINISGGEIIIDTKEFKIKKGSMRIKEQQKQ